MNILYYMWNEINRVDMIETLSAKGHAVKEFSYPLRDYLKDAGFVQAFEQELHTGNYDCMVTYNYFPVISKIALRNKIPYIAVVYDCPCLTLYSKMIYNPYNYVFHFDRNEVAKLRQKGVEHIYHLPLCVNTKRLDRMIGVDEGSSDQKNFDADVCFLGSLYTQKDALGRIIGLSDYQKGFLDGIIDSQMKVWGYDLIGDVFSDDFLDSVLQLVDYQLEDELFVTKKEILLDMIRKSASAKERHEILSLVSQHFKTTLYSDSESTDLLQVENRGYVGYDTKMPYVFNRAKINLNITIRSITSGISLRALDIMGAGGFLLSNYQPELAEYFVEGEEMAMYYSRQDLLEKIEYYLLHEEERMRIAKNGRKKIAEQFDYSLGWDKIMDTVF